MSIVASLLHENHNENLTTFPQINKTDFKSLFIFIYAAILTAHSQLNYQKTQVHVVNLLLAFCGEQGSSVLEKKVNETKVSKNVFSHDKLIDGLP